MAEPPDLTQYTTFVRNVMRIGTNYLPDGSPYLQHTFDHALDEVHTAFSGLVAQISSWSIYELMVYNLAGHFLIEFAADVSYPIASASWANGFVTVVTASAHEILPGDKVAIVGVSPYAYSGTPSVGYVIVQAVPDDTHFTYALATDPGAATILPSGAAVEQYFANARKLLKINSFVPGVVANTSDLTTSVGLDNPDFLKDLGLEQLQLMKTAYGRFYLSYAQKYGRNVWGLT